MSEDILDALYRIVDSRMSGRQWNIDVRIVPTDDTWITLPVDCLHLAVEELVEGFDVRHLSTIAGRHIGQPAEPTSIELLYHFWRDHGLTLRFVPPSNRSRSWSPSLTYGSRPTIPAGRIAWYRFHSNSGRASAALSKRS